MGKSTSSDPIVFVCLYSSIACLMIDFAPCGILIVNADLSLGSIGARFETTLGPYDNDASCGNPAFDTPRCWSPIVEPRGPVVVCLCCGAAGPIE